MSGETNPGGTFPQIFEGAAEQDEFFPVPDLVSSLIPPADPPGPFGLSGSEHAAGDGRTGGYSFFPGPPEGSSGIDEDGAQEVGCGFGGHGDGDFESGIGNGFAQEGSSGVHNAGVGNPAGYKRRSRGREGSDVRVGPPREFGAVELALRNSSTRTTKYILEPLSL